MMAMTLFDERSVPTCYAIDQIAMPSIEREEAVLEINFNAIQNTHKHDLAGGGFSP
jgi:hypothetical protein